LFGGEAGVLVLNANELFIKLRQYAKILVARRTTA